MPWSAGGKFQESQPSRTEFQLASSETIGTRTAAIPGRMSLGIQNRHIKQIAIGSTTQPSHMHRMAASVQLLATSQIFADPITRTGTPHWKRTGQIGRAHV